MRGRPNHDTAIIDRYFQGLPVEDATAAIYVVANVSDVEGAVRGDPHLCALSRACARLYDSTAVLFFRSVAYIDMLNDDGKRVLRRFRVESPVRRKIAEFDRTGDFPPGGFRLTPPPPSRVLGGAHNARRRQRRRARFLDGEAIPRSPVTATLSEAAQSSPKAPPKEHGGQHHPLALEGVRSGTGLVHFTKQTTPSPVPEPNREITV
jgi:hypothetical protein